MFRFSHAFIWGTLLLPLESVWAKELEQADAVVRLLNSFASRTDSLATANAGKLLSGKASPAEVVASELHKPLPSLGGWNNPETIRVLVKELGRYVESHPDQFQSGLPDVGEIADPLQLGPFFDGLLDFNPRFSVRFLKDDLAKVQPLLGEAWLEAAANCGSIQFQQLMLAYRGELGELLLTYEESQDDIALILLGETTGNYPDALQSIDSSKYSTRTLALLLSGSFAIVNPYETHEVAEIAAAWTVQHPELPVILRELRDPLSLSLFEAFLLWEQGEREASIRQLISTFGNGPGVNVVFVMRYFPEASLSDQEAASLIRMLPEEMLVTYERMSRSKIHQPGQARIASFIAAEKTARDRLKQPSK
jgi:hypothetical protein